MSVNVSEVLGLVNHSAEIDVLAGMLGSDELALALVQQLQDSEFYEPRRRVVFAAVRSLLLGIEPINQENILSECRRVAADIYPKQSITIDERFLHSLKGNPDSAIRSAITVHRSAWLRRAGDYAAWLTKNLQMNPDPNIFYTEAQEQWQMLAPPKRGGATLYGWETVGHAKDTTEKRLHEKTEGTLRRFDWPTQWKQWNDWVRPLRAGIVGVLAAPDGVGKSTYLEWIAEHWAQRGNKTVLVHLEDDHDYKLDRRKSRWSGVPLAAIEDAETTPEQDRAIAEGERRISEWADNLHYTHMPSASMSDLLAELQKLIDEKECDCVVLDYIDKCEADRRQLQLYGNNQYSREGDDMNRFKNFCEKNKIPGFTATQGNKSMQDQHKVQTRQAIDGSGKKSQRAQLVIIVTRPIVEPGGLIDNGTKIAEEGDYSPFATVRIDKQNRGVTRTFHQVFIGDCYRISDPPKGWSMKQVI
ncbi:MAG TPA: DnaB-like helicase C-terminal domain-containing protein [Pseudomonadales bacterium]|nr:DnaB-like helicase C-terminal domain-containing protein [Pseudomonadales bacterium]